MVGTTVKICPLEDGEPLKARSFEVDRRSRFMKANGMPVRILVIEMIEIGAGGGSLVQLDELRRIQVGAQSAGAEPGPACYGLGGEQAAVTDAESALATLTLNILLADASRFITIRLTRRSIKSLPSRQYPPDSIKNTRPISGEHHRATEAAHAAAQQLPAQVGDNANTAASTMQMLSECVVTKPRYITSDSAYESAAHSTSVLITLSLKRSKASAAKTTKIAAIGTSDDQLGTAI